MIRDFLKFVQREEGVVTRGSSNFFDSRESERLNQELCSPA